MKYKMRTLGVLLRMCCDWLTKGHASAVCLTIGSCLVSSVVTLDQQGLRTAD